MPIRISTLIQYSVLKEHYYYLLRTLIKIAVPIIDTGNATNPMIRKIPAVFPMIAAIKANKHRMIIANTKIEAMM